MGMLGDGLMVLRVRIEKMELANEMLSEKDCLSFAMKKSCV